MLKPNNRQESIYRINKSFENNPFPGRDLLYFLSPRRGGGEGAERWQLKRNKKTLRKL